MSAWRVGGRIGFGSSGEVCLAETPKGVKVAVKVLSVARSEEERGLFENQVRLLGRLRHPAIISVLGYLLKSDPIFGEDRGPCYWMEFVEGEDLLKASSRKAPRQILGWFREALEALRFVHSQGVVHGDLSPQNILIDAEGRLRLLDFSVLPGNPGGSGVATLPYMAPERIDGLLAPAGDLFSLGTIFYEALAGRHPRAGCRTISELVHAAPQPLLDASPRLQDFGVASRVIDRVIQAEPSRRFSDAGGVLDALDQGQWEDSAAEVVPYHPIRMFGADRHFAAVEKVLETIAESSAVLAVHGGPGVGKTRFLREIGFEAALKGAVFHPFADLHRAGPEELSGVLSFLRSLPPHGVLAALEWNDDEVPAGLRRFFAQLLAWEGVREIRPENLNREDALALLQGPLDPESAAALFEAVFSITDGNPGLLIETLRALSSQKKIRRRSLAPGWKDSLRLFGSPEEILSARLGDVLPDTLNREARRVVEDLWKAGRRKEALEALDYAADQIGDVAEVSRLLRKKTNFLNEAGKYEEAIACCDRWFALRATDEPLPLKTVKYWLITGTDLQNLERHAEAAERFRRCLEEGASFRGDAAIQPHLARAESLLGLHALKEGRPAEALERFERALKLAGADGPRRAEIGRNMAAALSRLGRWPEAKTRLDEAKRLCRENAHAEGEFSTFLQEGNLALENEDLDAAEAAYVRAEAIARGTKSDLRLAIARNNRGLLERRRGNLKEALDFLRPSRDLFLFLGNPNDLAGNLRELALAEASVGRFEAARIALGELRELAPSFPDAAPWAGEAEGSIRALEDGSGPPPDPKKLREQYEKLPPELQVTFVERGDWRKTFSGRGGEEEKKSMVQNPYLGDVLPSLCRLNERLLREEDVPRVLESLMDAAMRLARAETGLLVLRSDAPAAQTGPLPGFEVAISRGPASQPARTDLLTFSLSAIRRALETGNPVVTDNAVLDPLFREARSVHLRQLRSIVALPVHGADEVLGVFYLDHRLEEGLFEGDLLEGLKAFAGIASLALQKGRMITALREKNEELSERVHIQTRELNRSRLVLKNEYSEIVGRSPKMAEALSLVDKVTDADVPVWIYGESGTGKEAIARALHFNGPRAKRPFVAENCGALPESLLESELFGHKKGAFTHATADKKGILQYADGGTIFLDEIADMSPALQGKLLRFLQEGEVRPIGAHEAVKVDVRVVSASNKDLASLVKEGKFREDLFYRLNGVTVRLPPLRERREDIPLLAEHFLKKTAERTRKAPGRLDPAALRIFMAYDWPGNIRELQNTLATAVLFAEDVDGVHAITVRSLAFKPQLWE
ncbi:MAG TPA: sigma 54-interacting transcriptional regulator, partial [bacterium]|nr:sigma 54-interacting transcriptional regulator [bacterium]